MERQEATNDNTGGDCAAAAVPAPRRPRPARPGHLRRQVIIAAPGEQPLVGVPTAAQIELAQVLAPGRATLVPPKRPAQLPARFHSHGAQTALGAAGQLPPPGAGPQVGAAAQKPNRYSWAQMQRWQAAAMATADQTQGGGPSGAGGFRYAPEDGGGAGGGGFHYHFASSPFASAASRVLVVNPIVNLSEHTKSRLIKFIEAVKRFSEKWFSHVLLLLFLAVYACFGAYVFISFEAATEQNEKQLIIETRLRIVNESFDKSQELASSRQEYLDYFRGRFEDYELLLNRACASGLTSSSLDNQWTFWGALFYSMTVFTTIGYGHLTPVTFAGRAATMVYAIFGIPILLMVLADLGKLLTRIIKYTFKQFRCLYNKLLRRKASVRTRKLISDNTSQYIGVARNAFERGFASYIEPYQQRLPRHFRVARRHHAEPQPDEGAAAAEGGGGGEHEAAPEGRPQMTDVIVTPAKQTKPVSPPAQHHARKWPLGGVGGGGAELGHSAGNAARNERRAAAAADKRRRRKTSTGGAKPAAAEKLAAGKTPVSRSASVSNFADEKRNAPAALLKRLSVDAATPPSEPQVVPNNVAAEQNAAESRTRAPAAELSLGELELGAADGDADADEEADRNRDAQQFDAEQLDEDFDIPVSFALFLLITYMMFGAVVFSIWEGWNFFDALYFVFISMSTIGFGDLVPQHPKRMIGTFAYLLFGLALTSMCINVVQEKIHATFLRAKMQIGEKMGFDLDQIMADDYYDSNSAYTDEDLNSVTVSQTNESLNHDSQSPLALCDLAAAAADGSSAAALSKKGGSLDGHEPVGGKSLPKSKDSIKKKRNTWGLAPEAGGSAAALRRKSSAKKLSRQPTANQLQQSSPTGDAPQQVHQSPPPTGTPIAAPTKPVRAQLETVRVGVAPAAGGSGAPPRPSVNQPIRHSVRAFCEPLRRAFRGLPAAATPTQESSGREAGAEEKPPPAPSINPEPPPPATTTTKAAPTKTAPPQSKLSSGKGSVSSKRPSDTPAAPSNANSSSRSSSRRASVSQELNQLDDLIVELSRSPPERFGPLLGIPSAGGGASARSSRSASPMSSNSFGSRRSTSMTSRPSQSLRPAKKRSLVSQTSALLPSATTTTAAAAAAAATSRSLSASQAALDVELEALKRFSAV